MSEPTPDRIEKKIVLAAPIARVWKAISDAKHPLARRAKAFTMNEGGWEAQTGLVKKFVEG